MTGRLGVALAVGIATIAFLSVVVRVHEARWVTPDGASYGVVARSLLRGQGYTENVVPVHAVEYESVRHLPELHGLLRPVVLVPFLALFGADAFTLRLPGLLYAAGASLIVFAWGRRLFGAWPGLLGCALAATSVNLFYFGMLGTDDAGFAFFLVGTLALLDRALGSGHARDFLLAGTLGALALLEKPSGIILAGVFVAPVVLLHGAGARAVARALACLYVPLLAALAVYLVRNYLAGGSIVLRLGPLQGWILKARGYEGMMQVFDHPPGLLESMRMLGWDRVLALVSAELGKLAGAFLPSRPWIGGDPLVTLTVPTFIPALALAALAIFARSRPAAVAISVLALLGAALLLGIGWHHELRFLSFVVPLAGLWVGGMATLGRGLRAAGWRRLVRAAAIVGGVSLALTSATVFFTGAGRPREDAGRSATFREDLESPCTETLAWIASHTAAGDRLLTFNPWVASWEIDREAIMIPTGGPEVVATIARRYDARWLLAYPLMTRPLTSRVVMGLGDEVEGVRFSTAHEDGTCRVYRLSW